MSCRFPVLVAGVLLAGCGSSGTGSLFGGSPSASGGQFAANTGGVDTGATTGAGGATVGSGGTDPSGAGSGGTGAFDSGGSPQGGALDSGPGQSVPLDAAVPATVLAAGGIISQQCATCAEADCQDEEAACQADPACLKIYACVTSCVIPIQCAACVVGSGSGPEKFNTLECCTSRHCAGFGLCPSLNGGVLGCP